MSSMTESAERLEREEFEAWWQEHGQFMRAGGGQYEVTFAYEAWMARARRAPAEAGAADGWRLVPEILTAEMRNAAVEKDNEAMGDSGQPASIEGLWLAMLAAAPASPKQEG